MSTFHFVAGSAPLLVSFPHDGTELPPELRPRLTQAALALPDTDWHVARLYDFAPSLGASVLVANASRYVIDLNRDPSGNELYPGADNTELCPTTTFAREAIYRVGQELQPAEVEARTRSTHAPYHACLSDELARLRRVHGVAVLLDAHSIRSRVPRFFEGRLPDLNLGTASGKSCDSELGARAEQVLRSANGFSSVRDARFTGGYITRQYGRPAEGVHALQLEIAQDAYMDETPPFPFSEEKAARLRPTLRTLLQALIAWAKERSI